MVQWRTGNGNAINNVATVSDREGDNGLPFISSGDPRTTDTTSIRSHGLQIYFPRKYKAALRSPYYSPIVLADWIEARLIRAEAAYQADDPATMLSLLNQLRATALVSGQTTFLPATLTDPGSDSARVSLLFAERASWLYLTGHRQGDLRRLIRQYMRDESAVYPVGEYLAPGQGIYGSDVTAPIPSSEIPNPLFHGCIDREA
jgi:hypothetical protein